MFCPNCGYKNDENAAFCENCGSPMEQPKNSSAIKRSQEKREVDQSALSVGQYLKMMLLGVIPIVGFVLFIIWSFGANINENKRNWARATLIFAIILTVFTFIFYGILFQSIISSYTY